MYIQQSNYFLRVNVSLAGKCTSTKPLEKRENPPNPSLEHQDLILCSTICKLCSKCKTTQNVRMFKVLDLLSLLKHLSVNSLLFRVLWLKIPCPFALAVRNTPLTHEDKSRKLAVVILVVTNSSGKLGQVTPHISPSCRCFNLRWVCLSFSCPDHIPQVHFVQYNLQTLFQVQNNSKCSNV